MIDSIFLQDSELRKQLRCAADLQVQHNRKIDSLEEKLSDSQTQLDDIEREKRQLKTELQAAQVCVVISSY